MPERPVKYHSPDQIDRTNSERNNAYFDEQVRDILAQISAAQAQISSLQSQIDAIDARLEGHGI